jgi:hypothetical protein
MSDSSIKRSVEVLQAAVDLNGDNARAGAEPAGNLECGDEICAVDGPEKMPSVWAARRAMANASVSGTVTTSSKFSGRSSGGHDLIPPPSMWWVPGTPPDHSRFRWLDHHAMECRQCGSQPAGRS